MGGRFLLTSALVGLFIAYLLKFHYEKHPGTSDFLARTTYGSTSTTVRMAQAVGYQLVGRTPVCDFTPGELSGQLIILTGANSGIGFETAKALLRRGAHVIIVGRNTKKVEEAVNSIRSQLSQEGMQTVPVQYIVADVSDLNSVSNLIRALHHNFGSRKIDQLILNAGIWPQEYSTSPQGYEIAFATNAVGPHLLLRALTVFDVLKSDARVILVTGDIYITLAGTKLEDCTENFTYGSPAGQAGQDAYSRSKLGAMWLFYNMHAQYPSLQMNLVHPGVIDNSLTGGNPLPKALMISDEQGAQTTLICATAPRSQLENGGYYHNTLGRLVLPPNDPALNQVKATKFWDRVERIIAPYLRALSPEQPPVTAATATTAGIE